MPYLNFISSDLTQPDEIQPANMRLWVRPASSTMFTDDPPTVNVASDADPCKHWQNFGMTAEDMIAPGDGNRPLYRPNTQNGLPTLEFDAGGTENLRANNLGQYFDGDDTAKTVAAFFKKIDNSGQDTIFAIGSATEPDQWALQTEGATKYRCFKSDGVASANAGGGTPNTDPHWIVARDNGTTLDMWLDGVQIATAAAFDTGDITLISFCSIGAYVGTTVNQLFNGYIGEVIAWDVALTNDEVDDLNAYGLWKWGL